MTTSSDTPGNGRKKPTTAAEWLEEFVAAAVEDDYERMVELSAAPVEATGNEENDGRLNAVVRELAMLPARLSETDKYYMPEYLLNYAARENFAAACQYLIDNGADVDAECPAEWYAPLHYAVAAKAYEAAEVLLENGVEVDRETCQDDIYNYSDDHWYCTPLHLAVMHSGDEKLCRLLLRYGADVNAVAYGSCPLEEEYGMTPLHIAAERGDAAIIRLLLAHGADPNAVVENSDDSDDYVFTKGFTPLHFAAMADSAECCELLLQAGADVNASEGNLYSWYNPYDFGDPSCLECRSDGAITPLHLAGREAAPVLIAHNADVNIRSEFGRTPLHYAAFYQKGGSASDGDRELCELLIAHGAETDAEDGWGKTPLDYAICGSRSATRLSGALVALFERDPSAAGDKNRLLYKAAVVRNLAFCEWLLKNGANPGKIPFMGFVHHFDYAICEVLLRYGANPDFLCEGGGTPLHEIISSIRADENGVYREAFYDFPLGERTCRVGNHPSRQLEGWENTEGAARWRQSLPEGCRKYQPDYGDVCELLISYGANVNAKDHYGYTPLDLALEESRYLGKYGPQQEQEDIAACLAVLKKYSPGRG